MKDICDALDGEGAIDTHNVVEHSKSLIVIMRGPHWYLLCFIDSGDIVDDP